MSIAALFWTLLSVYLIAMLAIGIGDRRRAAASAEAYFVADRSLSPWRTFVGLASTTTGGSTTVVLCAAVATRGLPGLWYDFAGAGGLLLLGIFLAAKVRRARAITLPEIAGRLHGPTVRRTASALVVTAEIVWFALLAQATQGVLTAAVGVEPVTALVASTAVFVAYTWLGGQYSVIRTDLLQYALMWLALIGIGVPAAIHAAGGVDALLALPADVWAFPSGPRMSALEATAIVLTIGLPHLVGSDIWGKLLSARDERAARLGALAAGLAKLAFGLGIATIGLAAIALGTVDGHATLPRTLMAATPPALAALLLVGLVATMQSSSDTVLLTAVATTCRDLVPGASIRAARWLAVGYGVAGLTVALWMRDLLETLKLGYTLFAAGLILPILSGYVPLRFRPGAAFARAAMIGGAGVAILGRLTKAPLGDWLAVRGLPISLVDPVLLGLAASGGILLLGAVRTRATDRCPGDDLA